MTTLERRIARLEQATGGINDDELVELVEQLNPVEREQRLLVLRERNADDPTALAALDAALTELAPR